MVQCAFQSRNGYLPIYPFETQALKPGIIPGAEKGLHYWHAMHNEAVKAPRDTQSATELPCIPSHVSHLCIFVPQLSLSHLA